MPRPLSLAFAVTVGVILIACVVADVTARDSKRHPSDKLEIDTPQHPDIQDGTSSPAEPPSSGGSDGSATSPEGAGQHRHNAESASNKERHRKAAKHALAAVALLALAFGGAVFGTAEYLKASDEEQGIPGSGRRSIRRSRSGYAEV
jgi:hypothetical protein